MNPADALTLAFYALVFLAGICTAAVLERITPTAADWLFPDPVADSLVLDEDWRERTWIAGEDYGYERRQA